MTPLLVIFLYCLAPLQADTVSPLYARGYTVMPQPQVAKLGASDHIFSAEWKLELKGVWQEG